MLQLSNEIKRLSLTEGIIAIYSFVTVSFCI